MKFTFWSAGQDRFALSDGAGLGSVKGYIVKRDGAWFVEGTSGPAYLDKESAATSITSETLPPDGKYYVLGRNDEVRLVFTYPDVICMHEQDGWQVISRPIP